MTLSQDGCKALVGSLAAVMNNVNDPVNNWDEPVKECFEEADKKTRLAFECGPNLEQVCVDFFKNTENYDEAVQWKGSYDSRLSGASSNTPPVFLSLLLLVVGLSARIDV